MTLRAERALALVLTAALCVSACGAADDETTSSAVGSEAGFGGDTSPPVATTSASPDASSNPASDAEEGLVAASPADGDEASDRSYEDGTANDAEADLAGNGASPADEGGTGGDSGGFFGGSTTTTAAVPASGRDANTFQNYGIRPFVDPAQDPLSTFALDVDQASFNLAQRWVDDGAMPPADSVRVEEYVNRFHYDYPVPQRGLAVTADGGPSPFDPDNVILRLGVQAERVAGDARPAASLTFVVDTSGSMDRANRLGLVRSSLERLVGELDAEDTVAIVTYADNAEVILAPTSVARRETILAAVDNLEPTGSTNLEAGLRRGYDLAAESFRPGAINRVILASDGVANVGLTDPEGLVSLIRDDADRGIQLVTLGVGMGNFNDVVMEQLADDGDGFYAYIDDQARADQVFGDDLVSSLLTVALDAKIQFELDPGAVEAYRLIGFENRAVRDQDFRNDAVDAGELGAGHQVTALYELTLRPGVRARDSLGTVQLRWEDPEEHVVQETHLDVRAGAIESDWAGSGTDLRLAVTAAALGELLRGSPYVGDLSYRQVAGEAESLAAIDGAAADLAQLARDIDQLS